MGDMPFRRGVLLVVSNGGAGAEVTPPDGSLEGATVLRWTATSMALSNGQPVSDQLTARNGEPFRWRL